MTKNIKKKKLTTWQELAKAVNISRGTMLTYKNHATFPKDKSGEPSRDPVQIQEWIDYNTSGSNHVEPEPLDGNTLNYIDADGKVDIRVVKQRAELAMMIRKEAEAELANIELAKAKGDLIEYEKISQKVQVAGTTLKNDLSQIGKKARQDLYHYFKNEKDSHVIDEVVQELVNEAMIKVIDNLTK